MVSSNTVQALEAVSGRPDKEKALAYEQLMHSLSPASSIDTPSDLRAVLDSLLSASLGIVSTRPLVSTFVSVIEKLPNRDTQIEVGNHALTTLSAQASSFEEQTANLRMIIASAHEFDEDFLAAATVLSGINLDSSQREVTDEDKVKLWIRIIRDYLEIDDTTSAESYLNKAKNLIFYVKDRETNLHFKLSQARIQDSRRDFLHAAHGYQDISFMPILAEEERLHTLSMAIKCAVLAPAGPQRSRTLARLYKDERSVGLEEFGILEKMFLDRLLAPSEVEKFAEGLSPHQLAKTADGSTVLAKAVVEHNLLGASRLYSNIGFDNLGALLGLNGDKAEETTARMIEQGRLVGRIDQIERVIWFEGGEATGEKGSGRAEGIVGGELRKWDTNVQGLTEEVERVASTLQTKYPVGFFVAGS